MGWRDHSLQAIAESHQSDKEKRSSLFVSVSHPTLPRNAYHTVKENNLLHFRHDRLQAVNGTEQRRYRQIRLVRQVRQDTDRNSGRFVVEVYGGCQGIHQVRFRHCTSASILTPMLRHSSTSTTQTLLLTYILALCLRVDNYITDSNLIASDLSLPVSR